VICILPFAEICNNADDNCNGVIDEGLVFSDWFVDQDLDGFGANWYTNTCDDPGVGYALLAGDCNDADSLINPAAAEIPDNAVDENCDGQIVNGVADLKLQSLYVFPNPSAGVIEILGLTQTMQMEIFDVLGNLVFTQWVQKNERIHLDALSNGVYMIRLGNKYTQRIILAK